MHEVAAPLPFFFRELVGSGRVLLSNQLGAYAVLENRSQLEALIYGSIERLPSELVEELYAKCFLTEPRERRLRASLLASGLASTIAQALTPPGLFTVVPTLRCDHDCRYCQVSRAPIGASNRDLSLDSIPRILEHIQAVASEKLKIEFQGGEPLLAFDYIRSFVEQAERTLSNESVSYVICSALGPLTDEIIEWAREKEIFFSVSLDGNAFTHRRNCPSRFFDSYDNTINKIKKLQTAISYDRVSCIATVTRDMSSPK